MGADRPPADKHHTQKVDRKQGMMKGRAIETRASGSSPDAGHCSYGDDQDSSGPWAIPSLAQRSEPNLRYMSMPHFFGFRRGQHDLPAIPQESCSWEGDLEVTTKVYNRQGSVTMKQTHMVPPFPAPSNVP